MKNEGLASNLITVRMLLENLCDGFDSSCSSKNSLLTTKIKMLHLLDKEEKISPSLIINKVGIAKSNLAILARNMISEGLIEKLNDSFDKRVIYYKITAKGKQELEEAYNTIDHQVCDCRSGGDRCQALNPKLQEIINILK